AREEFREAIGDAIREPIATLTQDLRELRAVLDAESRAREQTNAGLTAAVADQSHALRAAGESAETLRIRLAPAGRKVRRIPRGLEGEPSRTMEITRAAAASAHALPGLEPEFDYAGFEEQFRGSEEDIKERQTVYVEDFAGRENVLDIGCGRGEFLEL